MRKIARRSSIPAAGYPVGPECMGANAFVEPGSARLPLVRTPAQPGRARLYVTASSAQPGVARRYGLSALIVFLLAACTSTDRLRDTQVRPMDRPECQVGTQRRDLDAGVPTLIGGTGCRTDPSNPRPLNKRPE